MNLQRDFHYEQTTIRMRVDENEQIWFAGIDVCKILGYAKPDQAIKKHLDEDERMLTPLREGSGQQRRTWTINEFGLYSLILSSTKPEAKKFKRWVTHQVLPAIRKAGRYTSDQAQNKELELQRLTNEVEEIEKRINNYKSEIKSWNTEKEEKLAELRRIIRTNPNQLQLELNDE